MTEGIKAALLGRKFHRLSVVAFSHVNKFRNTEWHCLCDCGTGLIVSRNNLVSGHKKSCGCLLIEANGKKLSAIAAGRRKSAIERLESGFKKCANPSCERSNPQPLDQFSVSRRHAGGKQPWCKSCYENNNQRHKKLKITPSDRRQLIESQDGRCAACAEEFSSARVYSIDHDHITGAIRGVLCGQCNRALGLLRDSPEVIRGLLDYAEKHRQLKLIQGGKK